MKECFHHEVMANRALIPWHEYSYSTKSTVTVSTGVAFVSVVLHSLSLPLFVLWIGLLGSITTWKLIRWKLSNNYELLQKSHQSQGSCDKQRGQFDEEDSRAACLACAKPGCQQHVNQASTETLQPWTNLTIPKKVDSALTDLLSHVLKRFIYTWHRQLTQEEAVVDELRTGLRFLVCKLLIRVRKVNLAEFICSKIVPAVVTHVVQHVHSYRKVGRYNADRIRLRRARVHRSLYKREDELLYLKQLASSFFPYVLPENVEQCGSLRLLLEQILAGVVLLPVADKIADPDIINNLLVIFFDEESSSVNPDPTTDRVNILAHFSTPNSTFQPVHRHDLGKILSNQDLLAHFIDVMKRNGGLKFLQFFLTLDHFKRKLLSSNLNDGDAEKLHEDALEMYRNFCRTDACDHVDIGEDLLLQFGQLAEGGAEAIKELETKGDFLARTYDYLYSLMDTYYLPIFRHSGQYFTYVYGEKDARPETSAWVGKGDRRGFKLSAKLRGTIKGEKLGWHSGSSSSLKDMDIASGPPTPDRVSLHDEDIVDESVLEELHDLSDWMVEIPSISIQVHSSGSREKRANFFQVKVYKNSLANAVGEPDVGPRIRTGSSVFRSYNDFYSLEQKLKHFHGEKLTIQLPPKKMFTTKDPEYLDSVKPSFEAFLKNVLNMSDLKNSELLHNFLTVEDFSKSNISEIRIESVLKSVPGRLVKEKGQNLKNFLKSLQTSTLDKTPRPDFSKIAKLHAEKKDKPSPLINRHLQNPLYERSHIRQPSNGVAVEPNNHLLTASIYASDQSSGNSLQLSSIVDCITRVAEEVFSIPQKLHWILSTIALIGKTWIDAFITWYVGVKLNQVMEEHRIEGLINLLRDNLFYGDGSIRSNEQREQRRIQALNDLKKFVPGGVAKLVGEESFNTSMEEIFEVLQHPKLNKQLVYILLDTIIYQLFPEMNVDTDGLAS